VTAWARRFLPRAPGTLRVSGATVDRPPIQPSRGRNLNRQPIRGGFVPATREGRERSPPEAPSAEPSVLRTTSPRARRPARLPRPSRAELLVRADRSGRFCRRPERSCVPSIRTRSLCLWGGALDRGPMHPFTRDTRECRALPGCTTQRFDFCNTTKTHEHVPDRTLEPHPQRQLSPTPRCSRRLSPSVRSELRDVIPMLRIASKQPRRRTRTSRRFRREQESRIRSDSELQARCREAPRFPRPARANLGPSPLSGPAPRFIAAASAKGWNP